MDFSNIFKAINCVVGLLAVLGGIGEFLGDTFLHTIIIGIYVIIFGLAILGLELLPQVPPYIPRYASFLFSFIGRGVFYVFIGTILLEKGFILRYIAGTIIGVTGLGYCALEFMPQIEPPSNMRDADAGWGAEQV